MDLCRNACHRFLIVKFQEHCNLIMDYRIIVISLGGYWWSLSLLRIPLAGMKRIDSHDGQYPG